MQYLLLIYENEADWNKMSKAETDAIYKEYGEFTGSITQSGNYKGGHQLQPSPRQPQCGCGTRNGWSRMVLSLKPRNSWAAST